MGQIKKKCHSPNTRRNILARKYSIVKPTNQLPPTIIFLRTPSLPKHQNVYPQQNVFSQYWQPSMFNPYNTTYGGLSSQPSHHFVITTKYEPTYVSHSSIPFEEMYEPQFLDYMQNTTREDSPVEVTALNPTPKKA